MTYGLGQMQILPESPLLQACGISCMSVGQTWITNCPLVFLGRGPSLSSDPGKQLMFPPARVVSSTCLVL